MRARKRRRQRFGNFRPLNLIFERAAFANDHRARDGVKQNTIRLRHLVGATQEGAARLVLQNSQTAGANHGLKFLMQQLQVGGGIVVENYQINPEPLVMQILMTTHQLAHDRKIFSLINSHHQNRQVATDAVSPQARLRQRVEREH